jgi:hypothetical protein
VLFPSIVPVRAVWFRCAFWKKRTVSKKNRSLSMEKNCSISSCSPFTAFVFSQFIQKAQHIVLTIYIAANYIAGARFAVKRHRPPPTAAGF